MIIKVYLADRIVTFRLPNDVSGSFAFDPDGGEDALINVEARNGIWEIYSTSDSKVVRGNTFVDSLPVFENSFYVVNKDNINYLIFVHSVINARTLTYDYKDNINLVIGNENECNIKYNNPYLKNGIVRITKKANSFVLEKINNACVYVNNVSVLKDGMILNIGDEIEIYGLKVIILASMVLINEIPKVSIDIPNCMLFTHMYENTIQPEEIEVKDKDLYKSDDYFSKSPGLRRTIKEKDIKLTPPPASQEEEEMPLLLTMGPMITMGAMSVTTLINTVTKLVSGQDKISQAWPSLLTCGAMLLSMFLWPNITRAYNKKRKKEKRDELVKKYTNYLNEKREELTEESQQQKIILVENLISTDDCYNILSRRSIGFWNKRIDQVDFLNVRIGFGDEKLKASLNYNEEDFAIDESELKKKANDLADEFKYIKSVPIGYSLYENSTTAIMGPYEKCVTFVNNIILQLITFYSYEDLKIVVFTNKNRQKNWEYLKYLNHSFSNERNFRFFATDIDSTKRVAEILNQESTFRKNNPSDSEENDTKPHYIIIVDGCEKIKNYEFMSNITEAKENIGYSLLILENRLSRLPSKCNNFISIGNNGSTLLKNSFEDQEKIDFKEELNDHINMMALAKRLSNIPIEFEDGPGQLPNSVTFMEMERVGKVEQLNVLNRWNMNDSTQSLRAEIGIDDRGDLMYLDLHEKFHGPHGLIAGMTGSGKSEFIITYILSMAINYSPDDVAFILIDYKGGGLAFAFENKTNGIILPHLAGTITNLDKAEMDRTLVSIDSEVKRRQEKFNEARDMLGESTIDIYKYQKFYKEGKLTEPIPHLFIICDEFAELKSQQPEFMDNLISVARIGRSLGVHLILATQKPSGVVNDQIWSNTKFRVCLRVQDEADSKEMLKRPEAAHIRQAGRYYLQVGYDEIFALGQSGWCGAKYYPAEKVVKEPDKSINFINDCGSFIKSIQASSGIKIKPQGEQLAAVMNNIIEVANQANKHARRLWLDNIPEIVLVDGLTKRYNVDFVSDGVISVIGEYDAPELQKQGIVTYNYLENGNTCIYGTDGTENEMLLNTLIYSTTKNYTADVINYYIVDFGSETMRRYNKLPHVGGVVLSEDTDKFTNLMKMLREEIDRRKKLFADYSGEFKLYNQNSEVKEPIITVIFNNYDSIKENIDEVYDLLPDLTRDTERYGIVYIFTVNKLGGLGSRVESNIKNSYVLTLNDESEYKYAFGTRSSVVPRSMTGRGLFKDEAVHEFQTSSIVENSEDLNNFFMEYIKEQRTKNKSRAKRIPVLPNIVSYDDVREKFTGIASIPIGIAKQDLEIQTFDFKTTIGTVITANKIGVTANAVKSLLMMLKSIKNYNVVIIDAENSLKLDSKSYPNYYTDKFDNIIQNMENFIATNIKENKTVTGAIVINGIEKLMNKLENKDHFNILMKLIKKYEKYNLIVVDSVLKLKNYSYEEWYRLNFAETAGVYIGKGVSDQSILKISNYNREMMQVIPDDMGYYIYEGLGVQCKIIDFITKEEE